MSWGQPKNWTPKWESLCWASQPWLASSGEQAVFCGYISVQGWAHAQRRGQETVDLGQGAAHDRRPKFVTALRWLTAALLLACLAQLPLGHIYPVSPSGSLSPSLGAEMAHWEISILFSLLCPPQPPLHPCPPALRKVEPLARG